jgi:4-hydroxy-tetrahydrodipicolinate reductase
MALSLFLNGARGRMGHAISAAAEEAGFRVGAAIDVGDPIPADLGSCDVIVDFSTPTATAGLFQLALKNRKPIVIGTTGHAAEEKQRLLAIAAQVPCVWAGNFSVGVNLLFYLTQSAARILDDSYDAEVLEMHHRFKKDAPSGTAARLVEIILEERKLPPDALRHGRNGITGERSKREVGIHSLRGGDVVGDHTVIFAALGERLELTHKTSDRAVLARGALRAAQWVVAQKPGVYDMQDVLGLRDRAQ